MTLIHASRAAKWVVFALTLVWSLTCSAESSRAGGESLTSVYDQAITLYRGTDTLSAFQLLNEFFDAHPYDEYHHRVSVGEYARILNDYAFIAYQYYLSQIDQLCSEINDSNVREILVFRAGVLEEAEEVLVYVLEIQPGRTVAYLNLADILYEMDWNEEAEKNYGIYNRRMISAGKSEKVPDRVSDPTARVKYYACSGK